MIPRPASLAFGRYVLHNSAVFKNATLLLPRLIFHRRDRSRLEPTVGPTGVPVEANVPKTF